ncbi:MAG: FAD-dependent monooxygenase [Planctomycetes bacterium]|nr:FAD-dependent monooxygenase [Planctomycetota bacterium]
MFERKKPEVLVVGAGPVGLFTALALHERGKQVQIVEKERRTGTRSYACTLHAASLGILDGFGLLGEVLAKARRLRSVGLYDEKQRRGALAIGELVEDHSFLAVLRQEDLENTLVEALAKRGVHVTWNHQVARLDAHADHVDIELEKLSSDSTGYSVQHTEWFVTKTMQESVPWVVGCDGHRSVVRRTAGIDYPEVGPASEFAVFEFKTDAELGDEMRLVLAEDSTNLCWPLPGGYCRWSFQQPTEEAVTMRESREKDRDMVALPEGVFPTLAKDRLAELIAQRAPWFRGSVDSMRWRMLVRFEQRLATSFGKGRLWLLGDSAHLAGPAGVHSMNVGFREGLAFADAIAKGGDAATMAAFDAARLAEWRGLLGIADAPQGAAGTDPWIAARAERLLACTPAAGADLRRLLGQVGVDWKAPAGV